MQQHPVPQNVTQYQFRLVGDMTLKQFLELLGGLVLAYLFFSSNLIFIFKYPLAFLSLLGGFGLAFFPIEDRPLDQWAINFIKSIYAPTRYIWKKSSKIPSVFTFQPHQIVEAPTSLKTVKAPSISDIHTTQTNDVSDTERQRINALDAMLAKMPSTNNTKSISPKAGSAPIDIPVKPEIAVRRLKPFSEIKNFTVFESAPRPSPVASPIKTIPDDNLSIPIASTTTVSKTSPVVHNNKPAEHVFVAKPSVKPASAPSAVVAPANIHLPAAPAKPNLVVGMVVDKDSKIVENAIVQIVTSDGIPARAMKTNSLGQFYTSTPLTKGIYTLEVEKDGFSFPNSRLEITDSIVQPILLKAS